jgi:hypothetical protein
VGTAWHQPQLRQTDSNLSPGCWVCEWQACDMRMQQAGTAGAVAATAKAVAIGQHKTATATRAIARCGNTPRMRS